MPKGFFSCLLFRPEFGDLFASLKIPPDPLAHVLDRWTTLHVLMNPLSAFGRGVKSQGKLAADAARMRAIRDVTEGFRSRGIDVVHIRFPNDDKPLAGCDAGKLIYVFAEG